MLFIVAGRRFALIGLVYARLRRPSHDVRVAGAGATDGQVVLASTVRHRVARLSVWRLTGVETFRKFRGRVVKQRAGERATA